MAPLSVFVVVTCFFAVSLIVVGLVAQSAIRCSLYKELKREPPPVRVPVVTDIKEALQARSARKEEERAKNMMDDYLYGTETDE